MGTLTAPSHPAYAYDVLAPYYDDFTARYAYGPWIEAIEDRAVALGLSGRRALDLACGTGKRTGQLIDRGYSVLGCDISPGMSSRRRSPARPECSPPRGSSPSTSTPCAPTAPPSHWIQ